MADQYQQYSTVRKYWHLMRPHTLTASIVPVLVGTATAKLFLLGSQDHIKFSLFLMLIACLLIQARLICLMNIMILKRIRRSYICRHRWRDCSKWYESKTCHESSNCFYIIAALLGIYLAVNSSFWIIPVGIVCMAIGYLYTGGPIPISWTPFGELFSGLFMGMIIILLAFFIQTGNVNGFVVWISLPIVITIGLINMANNIRDRVKDKASGRKTFYFIR